MATTELPIKAYDTLDEAIDRINAGERPLALYVFTKDEAVADQVLRRTTSGGACVNSAAVHGALPSLPFGGTGQSSADPTAQAIVDKAFAATA